MWRLLIYKTVPKKTPEIFPKRKGTESYRKKLSYTSKFKKLFQSNGYLYIKSDVNIQSEEVFPVAYLGIPW